MGEDDKAVNVSKEDEEIEERIEGNKDLNGLIGQAVGENTRLNSQDENNRTTTWLRFDTKDKVRLQSENKTTKDSKN